LRLLAARKVIAGFLQPRWTRVMSGRATFGAVLSIKGGTLVDLNQAATDLAGRALEPVPQGRDRGAGHERLRVGPERHVKVDSVPGTACKSSAARQPDRVRRIGGRNARRGVPSARQRGGLERPEDHGAHQDHGK
jgi:hypothetical protein